jgi:hypothetical protein
MLHTTIRSSWRSRDAQALAAVALGAGVVAEVRQRDGEREERPLPEPPLARVAAQVDALPVDRDRPARLAPAHRHPGLLRQRRRE